MQTSYMTKKMNKANIAYEILYEGILRGAWKPGDRLYDNELAEKLGTSRNSVREALSNLVKNHLVEKEHWKGYRVSIPEWKEISEVIDLRECLELFAIKKLEELPVNDYQTLIETLKNYLDNAGTKISLNSSEYRKMDMTFHQIIYNSVSDYWLTEIITNLHAIADIQTNIQVDLYPEVLSISFQQHKQIYESIVEKDFKETQILMKEHLESYKKRAHEAYMISFSNTENNN